MSTWRGISHGRTTRAMERTLSPAEFKVVAVVRRLIPDGQRRKISQADIARKACVGEGTVSRTMRKVDEVFFRRHFVGRGRGNGYEIEALPPAEHLRLPVAAPEKPSTRDRSLETAQSGTPMPQTAPEKGSLANLSIFMSHAHEQQQQTAAPPPEADRAPEPAAQLAPETIAALESAGAHPKLIARVAANNPACTPAQVATQVAAAQAKPNAHTPPGLALECLANRQQVIIPRPRPEPSETPPASEKRRGGREAHDASKTDWAALVKAEDAHRAAEDARRAARADDEAELLADLDEALRDEASADPPPATPAPPATPPGQDLAALIAEALALLGDAPPDTVERGRISYLIRQERRSPAQAVATLRAERERRRRPKNRAPARRPGGGT
jgi:hypothetical protein